METFSDVITRWPSAEALAAELKVSGLVARQWKRRQSIPAPHWAKLVAAAQKRGFEDITLEALARLAASEREAA